MTARPLAAVDFFTHGLVPFAVLMLATRRIRLAVAAAAGGFAPDLDVLYAWIADLRPELYALGHRGFSHTLLGAPGHAAALWLLLTKTPLVRRWKWGRELGWDRASVAALLASSWSHLVLDAITITGVPALYPFDSGRISLNAHFFILPFMALAAIAFWFRVLRGRTDARTMHAALAVLGVLLAAAGLVRWASFPPDAEAGQHVVPAAFDWQWHVVSEEPDDVVRVRSYAFGSLAAEGRYAQPNATAASSAILACRLLPEYAAFRWDLWGPEHVAAAGAGDASWNVTIRDAIRLHQDTTGVFQYGPTSPRDLERDEFRCHVDATGHANAS